MADANVVQKPSTTDRMIILSPRAYAMQPFRAPNWTDLRVGWFLSLTKTTGGSTPDDDPTGLGEVIANPGTLPATDRYWIGLRSRGITMPGEMDNRATFIGFTNRGQVSNVDRVG